MGRASGEERRRGRNAMRQTVTAVLIVVLVAVAVGVGTALVVGARQEGPPPPRPGREEESQPRSVPSLTPAQREQAIAIITADARLKALLGDRPWRIEKMGAWHTSTGRVIGAGAEVALSSPATLEGEWLGMHWDESLWPPYLIVPQRAKFSDVSHLHVLVDLDREQVVAVFPGVGAKLEGPIEYPPGYTPPPVRPSGD